MRQNLVIANWKLNGSMDLMAKFAQDWNSLVRTNTNAVICPPAVFIGAAKENYPQLNLGAQTCSAYEEGAFTGELAASMLKAVGASYVLVGHSERRALFAESNQVVAEKVKAAQEAGLVPVLCVGETADERNEARTEQVILQQLEEGLANADLDRLVIAYEPVWAIGTGLTASPEQAQEIHKFIRGWVAQKSVTIAEQIQLLYGGSVKPANAAELFQQEDIDGGLIGGASLKLEQFQAICMAAQEK